MLFGVTPREWGDFYDDALAQIKTAERTGFHSVWFEEHHEHTEYLPDPLMALAMVSRHTNLKLGTNVAILPLHNPFRLAEETSMLDCVSGGRMILGVAAGYRPQDFKNFGVNLEDRGGLMDESIVLVKKLLSEEHVSFSGEHFNITDATIQPRPVQRPRPPVWVGGWKKPALLRAAKLGDAWFPGPTASLRDVLACKEIYSKEVSRLGRRVNSLPIMRDVYVADSVDKAYRECRESFEHMYQEDYKKSGHPLIGGVSRSFEGWAEDRFLIGDADTVSEGIAEYQKNGFGYVVLRFSLRRLTSEQIVSSIRLFGEKVIPQFRTEGDEGTFAVQSP